MRPSVSWAIEVGMPSELRSGMGPGASKREEDDSRKIRVNDWH